MEALSILIKPVSGSCNMHCEYCFYADVTKSREQADYGKMDLDTLEAIVKKAMNEVTEFCSFGFQGGEPMLAGLPFFEKLTEFQKKYNKKNIEIFNSIQTNGTLVDDSWAEFFKKNNFLVGLSVDGSEEMHDSMRIDNGDRPTHKTCMTAAKILRKHEVEFNILSVVSGLFASEPEKAYKFYKDNDLRFIQFIPCLDGLSEPHGSNPFSLSAEQYGNFLCKMFDLWHEDFIQGNYYSIRMFDNWVRMVMGQQPENCGMSGQCLSYPLIEADGSVFPCDFYVIDKYKLGNIRTDKFGDLLSGNVSEYFMKPSRQTPDECKKCEYLMICRNGCRRDREPVTDDKPAQNYYCDSYKKFFDHSLNRMKAIADNIIANSQ